MRGWGGWTLKGPKCLSSVVGGGGVFSWLLTGELLLPPRWPQGGPVPVLWVGPGPGHCPSLSLAEPR